MVPVWLWRSFIVSVCWFSLTMAMKCFLLAFVLQGAEFRVMLRRFVWGEAVCKGSWPKAVRIRCVQGKERGWCIPFSAVNFDGVWCVSFIWFCSALLSPPARREADSLLLWPPGAFQEHQWRMKVEFFWALQTLAAKLSLIQRTGARSSKWICAQMGKAQCSC